MPTLSAIVRYGYAPFMMLGMTAAAYWVESELVLARSLTWAYLLLMPLLVIAYAIAFAAERIAPFFEEWNDQEAHGDNTANVLHILVYEWQVIIGIMLIPTICWLFPFPRLWPVEWPMWAQLVMAFILADFAFMMIHYVSHHYPPLWRLHAVHHGVSRLYGLNGVLRHPLHQIIDMIVGTMPLVILGMPAPVAVVLAFLLSMTLIVQHSNVDAHLGPLQQYLAIGRVHHLHHVNWGNEGDCNFGLFFNVWDRVCGTFQEIPSRPITARDMGVDEVPDFPKAYVEQLLFPIFYKPGQGEPERYRKRTIRQAQEARHITSDHE